MKRLLYSVSSLLIVALLFNSCKKDIFESKVYDNPTLNKKSECTTIQSGLIMDSQGNIITTGYNTATNYNYQAHMYNGDYWGNGGNLIMKWNDAWLSNKDCDGDGMLDRPDDNDGTYIGSGAWLTNHYTETYTDDFGNTCNYTEFIKIIAAPSDAYVDNGFWYNADGTEIGEVIWGSFAIIQYVINDPCEGQTGKYYKSPDHPGLGNW